MDEFKNEELHTEQDIVSDENVLEKEDNIVPVVMEEKEQSIKKKWKPTKIELGLIVTTCVFAISTITISVQYTSAQKQLRETSASLEQITGDNSSLEDQVTKLAKDYAQVKLDLKDSTANVKKLNADKDDLTKKNTDLEKQVDTLNTQIDELQHGASNQLTEIKNSFEEQKWQEVVDKAATLHQKYNGSAEDSEAQNLSAQAQQKINEAAAAKAAEEARGYETGITYDQLARTPDQFSGQKIKFSGKVLQVMEDDGYVAIRLAVNKNSDKVLYGVYQTSIVANRILEDDIITVYGTSAGIYSYTSTLGAKISIPSALIEKIDQ